MTTNGGKRDRVNVTVLDALPDETARGLVIERSLLPMLIWEGVQVNVRTTEGITLVERFVVECLLTLEQCLATELQEIASIPPELSRWILSSLVQKKLAVQDGEWFRANADACTEALSRKCLPVERSMRRTFLWFPETDEVVVLNDAGTLLKDLRHIQPERKYPLPDDERHSSQATIIREAKKAGRLYGDDAGAIGEVVDSALIEQEECPAYLCRAVVPHDATDGWAVSVIGYRKRKKNSHHGHRDEERADDIVEASLPLPLLPEQIRVWRGRLEGVDELIAEHLEQQFHVTDVTAEEREVRCSVSGDAARDIGRERVLVNRFGLSVRVDDEIEFGMPLRLRPHPGDSDAKKQFVIDKAVQEVLAGPRAASAEAACAEAGVELPEVVDRLWGLKAYHAVYDLRQAGDFQE